MTIGLQPPQSGDAGVLAALRDFMISVLPDGVDVVQGQSNRVPEPETDDFVVFTPLNMSRLATNLDTFVDARFQGAISGTTLTATFGDDDYGELKAGSVLFGVGMANPTKIVEQLGGTAGRDGTYTVSQAQNLSARTMAAGVLDATQNVEWTIQLDVHGDNKSAADNAARLSTMFRDEYATRFFKTSFPDGSVTPLHADAPKQIPFVNAEKQWEDRWSIDACLQVNATVTDIPQEFFEQVVVTFIPVDIMYPASA